MAKIGVFVCWCGSNIAETVDSAAVAEYAASLPGVVLAQDYKYTCSDPGQKMITDGIKEHGLTGVVIASCSPRMHEMTFRRTAATVGLNPYLLEMANIREHCSWVHHDREEATEKAKVLVRMIIEKVKKNHKLYPIKVPVTNRALVIGGGIAGIQAALDIAKEGHEVIIVEKQSSIGGHMSQLDETFPTLDCSQCILTPRMVEVVQDKNIKLYTYSEVEAVSGFVGNFKVKIRRKSRFINEADCTGCGDCEKPCPVERKNEFNEGLDKRKAIYRPFPQAVPNSFLIEKSVVPAPCKVACPIGQNVQGYVALISQNKFKEALAIVRDRNPFPSICGRVCTHVCEDACNREKIDQPIAIAALKRFLGDYEALHPELIKYEEPKELKTEKVAVIGAGPAGLVCAYQLAKEGYPVDVFEATNIAGGTLYLGIPEYRLPRDVIAREIAAIEKLGVKIKLDSPIDDAAQLLKDGYKAVFIGAGSHKGKELGTEGEETAGVTDAVSFLREVNLGRLKELSGRVIVVGGGNAAIDAARTALRLGASQVKIVYRRSKKEMPADPREVADAIKEGIGIEFLSNPKKIISQDGKIIKVECLRMELGEPDESGRRRPVPVAGSEFIIKADLLIRAVSQKTDINFDKSGKLELSKWQTIAAKPLTLETSAKGIFAGGDAVNGPETVVKAIADGYRAAESIRRFINAKDLEESRELPDHKIKDEPDPELFEGVEKAQRIELPETRLNDRSNFKEVTGVISEEQAVQEAQRCLNCGICSECGECVSACEKELINHDMKDEIIEEDVGAIVVATGYDLMDPSIYEEYGYKKYPDVVTSLEFERMVSASGPTNGKLIRPSDGATPKNIVFIQCVGSRDESVGVPYCSGICCMYTAKHTMLFKHKVPDGKAFVFYMDVRASGKNYEQFIRRVVTEKKAIYLRGRVAKIFNRGKKLIVRGADTLSGGQVEIEADMVVLANAVVASVGADKLAQTLKISYDEFNFFSEAHPKLRPVETNTAGIFLAGTCQAPRDIPETVAQASGAAAKVLGIIHGNELEREPAVGVIKETTCNGCFDCQKVCAYTAVEEKEIKDRKGKVIKIVASINQGICQGCGACAATCHSNSIEIQGFTDEQLYAQIIAG